ncbi:MAG: hypothetical protein QOE29_340 [Gaiellaceae bacterium]|nr:hypothetical protein [Gaiellaceae bacterium]
MLAAFVLRRKRSSAAPGEDPAAELRRKLAASRETEAPVSEPEVATAPEPDSESRRRDVHEQARAAIDEMQRGDEG